jgi:hypothetical protein
MVALRITKSCLRSIHTLTLSGNEWGGSIRPAVEQGRCVLSCESVRLIQGTGLGAHRDRRHYAAGGGDENAVLIASTPLDSEVHQVMPVCDTGDHVNVFFHTHPLHLAAVNGPAMFAPPSIGDIFAHVVLSNYRNFTQHGQVNTCMVMAFEGLYVYGMAPEAFAQMYRRMRAAAEQWPCSAAQLASGDLPLALIERFKTDVFGHLVPGFNAFVDACHERIDRNPDAFSIAGAPLVNSTLWTCRGCEPDGLADIPFRRTVQQASTRAFLGVNNPLLKRMRRFGFTYQFYPAPFESDVIIEAA